MEIKCPRCGSTSINQFRMPTGAIWCVNCGFRVEQKELGNPFIQPQPASALSAEELIKAIKKSLTPSCDCDDPSYDAALAHAEVIALIEADRAATLRAAADRHCTKTCRPKGYSDYDYHCRICPDRKAILAPLE